MKIAKIEDTLDQDSYDDVLKHVNATMVTLGWYEWTICSKDELIQLCDYAAKLNLDNGGRSEQFSHFDDDEVIRIVPYMVAANNENGERMTHLRCLVYPKNTANGPFPISMSFLHYGMLAEWGMLINH